MTDKRMIGPVSVLSAASGAGHMRAAEALVKALNNVNITAVHTEVLKYTNSVFKKLYSDLYLELVNKRPELFGFAYKSLDRPWKYQRRRLALDRLSTGRLVKRLMSEPPAMALCTHFLPAEIMLYLKKKGRMDVPIGIVITDFDIHALWLMQGADWYFVGCDEARAYLVEVGIPEDRIYVTGIPIDPAFAEKKSKIETRLTLGLDPDMDTVLVSAGGFGVGPMEAMVESVLKVRTPVQVAVISGRNETLKKRLEKLAPGKHKLKVVGYTTEMDRWMAASDILVGKPGGLTSSEAMASGLVMVIVNPVPGQEERNSDRLLEEGAALRSNNLPTLHYKIDLLLRDRERLDRMRKNVDRLARPDAARDIVSIALGGH